MPYDLPVAVDLGAAYSGLADLRAQLRDEAGTGVGAEISITSERPGGQGLYYFSVPDVPDDHAGYVDIYQSATPTKVIFFIGVDPQAGGGSVDEIAIADAVLEREHAITPAAGTLGYFVKQFMSMTETAGVSRKWTNAALAEIFTRLDVSVSSRLAAADYAALPGPNIVTVTVTDSTTAGAIEGARVAIRDEVSSAIVAIDETDAAGQISAALASGQYRSITSRAGYYFDHPVFDVLGADVSVAVSGTSPAVILPPAAADDCRVYFWAGGFSGGDTVTEIDAWAEIDRLPATREGRFWTGKQAPVFADGVAYWDVVRGVTLHIVCADRGLDVRVQVPDTETLDLSTIF